MLPEICFYILSTLLIVSAGMTVLLRDKSYSFLYLSISFFSISGIFLTLQSELIAVLFLFLYAGTIGTSFFFIAKKIPSNNRKPFTYTIALLSLIFVSMLAFISIQWSDNVSSVPMTALTKPNVETSSLFLSEALYTKYILLFELSGLILFIGIIISIMLTLNEKKEIG